MKLYKPKLWLVMVDVIIIIINTVGVLLFFPLTSSAPFSKYAIPAILYTISWLLISYLFQRYKNIKAQTFFKAAFSLLYTIIVLFVIFGGFILIQKSSPYSQYVLLVITVEVFITNYVFLFIYFTIRYATQYEVPLISEDKRALVPPVEELSLPAGQAEERKTKILAAFNEKMYCFLDKKINLNSSGVKIMIDFEQNTFQKDPPFQFNTYIQLRKINNIRGLNKMFAMINEKITDNGKLIVFYISKSAIKQKIYLKYPKFIAHIVYVLHFIFHRVMPKFFLTKRLYFDITSGKKRTLSKAEVLGRLSFCGFKIEREYKVGDIKVVFANREKTPHRLKPQRFYGPMIKLTRFGKDGKTFNVYKMRTMHPYSEFLQNYIFENNQLQEGGKFNKDIRITTMGRFMRKYWMDEIPMFINFFKGEMKLIGVRPLSKQYFNLYTPELQKKRVKFKPGLFPPFYVDMPKTLEEIQASEMKYLNECEQNGVIKTDAKYFFLIFKNILFKKVHSA